MPMYKITVDRNEMSSVDFPEGMYKVIFDRSKIEVFYREARDFNGAIDGIDGIKSVEEVGKSFNDHIAFSSKLKERLVHTK